ncbi:hypothetical protein EKH55_2503 [Sinorhizobium alkalisoli]|nr:hypothetical protein EKH55_2503 [Sinorhizobium alkalisoli]
MCLLARAGGNDSQTVCPGLRRPAAAGFSPYRPDCGWRQLTFSTQSV